MDRAVSMILRTASIREVIAFPKNRSAVCPLTGAPSAVEREQLAELGLLNLGGPEVLPGASATENLADRLSWVSRVGLADGERPLIEQTLAEAEALAVLAGRNAGTGDPVHTVAPAANRTRPGTEEKPSVFARDGRLLQSAPVVKGGYYKVAGILE